MPESPELRLDVTEASISRTLKFETLVTPKQYASARQRLLLSAAAQTILPPLETDAELATLRDRASIFGQHTRRLLNFLLVDSSAYERARRPPRLYCHYNAHGRYAFTIIHMSA